MTAPPQHDLVPERLPARIELAAYSLQDAPEHKDRTMPEAAKSPVTRWGKTGNFLDAPEKTAIRICNIARPFLSNPTPMIHYIETWPAKRYGTR